MPYWGKTSLGTAVWPSSPAPSEGPVTVSGTLQCPFLTLIPNSYPAIQEGPRLPQLSQENTVIPYPGGPGLPTPPPAALGNPQAHALAPDCPSAHPQGPAPRPPKFEYPRTRDLGQAPPAHLPRDSCAPPTSPPPSWHAARWRGCGGGPGARAWSSGRAAGPLPAAAAAAARVPGCLFTTCQKAGEGAPGRGEVCGRSASHPSLCPPYLLCSL